MRDIYVVITHILELLFPNESIYIKIIKALFYLTISFYLIDLNDLIYKLLKIIIISKDNLYCLLFI